MTPSMIRRVVQIGAYAALVLGTFGMLFCFPFLWSGRIEDLVGAGFPFVGAAVLFGSGLIALAMTVGKTDSRDANGKGSS